MHTNRVKWLHVKVPFLSHSLTSFLQPLKRLVIGLWRTMTPPGSENSPCGLVAHEAAERSVLERLKLKASEIVTISQEDGGPELRLVEPV